MEVRVDGTSDEAFQQRVRAISQGMTGVEVMRLRKAVLKLIGEGMRAELPSGPLMRLHGLSAAEIIAQGEALVQASRVVAEGEVDGGRFTLTEPRKESPDSGG